MKVYTILHEDTHYDPEVEVWTDPVKAIARAIEIANIHNRGINEPRIKPIDGWLFHIVYGAEHSVRVEEKELK